LSQSASSKVGGSFISGSGHACNICNADRRGGRSYAPSRRGKPTVPAWPSCTSLFARRPKGNRNKAASHRACRPDGPRVYLERQRLSSPLRQFQSVEVRPTRRGRSDTQHVVAPPGSARSTMADTARGLQVDQIARLNAAGAKLRMVQVDYSRPMILSMRRSGTSQMIVTSTYNAIESHGLTNARAMPAA
jgi:hypothetical protein